MEQMCWKNTQKHICCGCAKINVCINMKKNHTCDVCDVMNVCFFYIYILMFVKGFLSKDTIVILIHTLKT